MPISQSSLDPKRRVLEAPDDASALLASAWPPRTRADLGRLPATLRRAATLPDAVDIRHRAWLWRLMQVVTVFKKRAASYGKTATWSMTAPNGQEILFPLGEPGAVAFKAMADEYGQDYEKALIEYVVTRLVPGDVFIDVGAHVGYISAFAATTGASVFAIELQRELIPLIEQLATLNPFDTLRPLHAGASGRAGLGAIPRINASPGAGFTSANRSITSDDPRSIADDFVPMITLDDAFGSDRLWPSMVKIDAEGHEIAVIDGAHRIIEHGTTTFAVEFHPHLVGMYDGTAEQLLAPFPVERWRRSQLTDDGLRPIRRMTDVTPDPRDPNPKLVFEPLGV